MTKFFIGIYNYFEGHKGVFYLTLVGCIVVMSFFAARVRFDENITGFFPDTKEAQNTIHVFDDLKIKDKISIMVSASDSAGVTDKEALVKVGTAFRDNVQASVGETHIRSFLSRANDGLMMEVSGFVYDYLPLFLSDEDYHRFDTLTTRVGIEALVQKNYSTLLSPTGSVMKDYIIKDPLGLSGGVLKHLQDFQPEANYIVQDGYIFSRDSSHLLMFITPVFPTANTRKNDVLITAIEDEIAALHVQYPEVQVEYVGGPSIGVYNARQIKKDTVVTMSVALIIIIVFISLVFKRKSSIPLIITPVLFGVLFSLFMIFIIRGSISAIAVGAGSVVLGIALSYSIHVLAHQNHVSSVRQLIKELTYPLTVGSFTTIGAFFGLMFTTSGLLRDFGLFASLALIGTTLFCLIFLPHFLKGQADVKQGYLLRLIEKGNAYVFEKNKWLVWGIILLTGICLFQIKHVRFDSDMMALNYEPEHLKQSEKKLMQLFGGQEKTVLFVSVGKNMTEATSIYAQTNKELEELSRVGLIKGFSSAGHFIIPVEEQQRRLQKWNDYWTPSRKLFVRTTLQDVGSGYHFKEDSFNRFYQWLDKPFSTYNLNEENTAFGGLLNEWMTSTDSATMIVSQVRFNATDKESVYKRFTDNNNVVIFDRSFFASKWVSAVKDDFYLILYLSSCLIFLALLIAYGRIELTLMSFLPMFISWIIILGLMGMLNIKFNIINIIFSTFVFGIGDDFSIFVMDGLQNQYRTGQKVLNAHKTAIFFAAFTTVVGMSAMLFARHPALQSISLISILGVISVVLVAYTIQPVLFHFFITSPASRGLPPYTLGSLLQTVVVFWAFVKGFVILRILMALTSVAPVRKAAGRRLMCFCIMYLCRIFLWLMYAVKKEKFNVSGESFRRPSVVVASVRSYLDILVVLSLAPKLVMITGRRIWDSPYWGPIVRYAGYFCEEDYPLHVDRMRAYVNEGYSFAIFSEHNPTCGRNLGGGSQVALDLSDTLHLDIIPILIYGSDMVVKKSHPFHIHSGMLCTKILPRIACAGSTFPGGIRERVPDLSDYIQSEYETFFYEKNTPENPYFYHALIKNFVYKGPVEEWYMRIKVKMENNYSFFNKLIPLKGQITDIGCGYGPLCSMLGMISPDRNILGIDYDEDKIAVARHCYAKTDRIHFIHANVLTFPLPESDVFVLNDVLHYLGYDEQATLLRKCCGLLRPEGLMIVRDGNTSDLKKHLLTRCTEFISTRISCFNKSTNELCFPSDERMIHLSKECGMNVESVKNDKYTSNTIYVFRKKHQHE